MNNTENDTGFLNDKLGHYREEGPASAWQKLEGQLPAPKRRRRAALWLWPLLAVLLVSGSLIWLKEGWQPSTEKSARVGEASHLGTPLSVYAEVNEKTPAKAESASSNSPTPIHAKLSEHTTPLDRQPAIKVTESEGVATNTSFPSLHSTPNRAIVPGSASKKHSNVKRLTADLPANPRKINKIAAHINTQENNPVHFYASQEIIKINHMERKEISTAVARPSESVIRELNSNTDTRIEAQKGVGLNQAEAVARHPITATPALQPVVPADTNDIPSRNKTALSDNKPLDITAQATSANEAQNGIFDLQDNHADSAALPVVNSIQVAAQDTAPAIVENLKNKRGRPKPTFWLTLGTGRQAYSAHYTVRNPATGGPRPDRLPELVKTSQVVSLGFEGRLPLAGRFGVALGLSAGFARQVATQQLNPSVQYLHYSTDPATGVILAEPGNYDKVYYGPHQRNRTLILPSGTLGLNFAFSPSLSADAAAVAQGALVTTGPSPTPFAPGIAAALRWQIHPRWALAAQWKAYRWTRSAIPEYVESQSRNQEFLLQLGYRVR